MLDEPPPRVADESFLRLLTGAVGQGDARRPDAGKAAPGRLPELVVVDQLGDTPGAVADGPRRSVAVLVLDAQHLPFRPVAARPRQLHQAQQVVPAAGVLVGGLEGRRGAAPVGREREFRVALLVVAVVPGDDAERPVAAQPGPPRARHPGS